MRKSIVKANLAAGKPSLMVTAHFTDQSVYEILSLMGFHAIWMDLEHHAYSVETANGLMRASRVGNTDIMARCARGEYMRMGRLLEAGATGILYPRCADADEAREVVRWSKFHPMGTRGFDGGNPDMPYLTVPMDEYVRIANEETFIGIQIEDEESLDHAEEIAAVDGVDFLFMGPGDFSILAGIPGQFDHPKIQKAMEKIARVAKNTGKHWGRPAGSPKIAKQLLDMGALVIAGGADIVFMRLGFDNLQSQYRELGFEFDSKLPPL
jgi:4-hydroxy-2-oxoheptanedioate aldolase